MTSQPVITAEDQRIHELDHDVERVFDVRKRLGKGAYGIVWKAIERQKKTTVALKKIFDAFRDETDAQRTYREVIFLRAFRHHPNIIRLIDVYKAGNNLDFYLVFEFMESDLHNVIKRGDILKDVHKRFIMYQLVNAIKYMHSGNVVHRDLKPSNILIDSKCRLKVADFGLARTLYKKRNAEPDDLEHGAMLTDYVATRWYRAPEILVASRTYTKAIDMWSLGCILGELIRQKPLFQGTSTINQIEKIVSALPDVTQQDIDSIGASFGTVLLSKKINRDRRHSLEEMLRHCSDDAMTLLKSLLVLDPHRRLTAKAAILHPYVTRFRTASADMELRSDVHPPLRDDVRYNVNEYRSNLYDAMVQESWSSGRTERTTSPPSNRDSRMTATSTATATTTTKKPSRSVSRTRTLSANQTTSKVAAVPAARKTELNHLGVSTLQRNITQSWAESDQKRTSSSSALPPKQSASVPTHVKDMPHNGRTNHSSSSLHPKQPVTVVGATSSSIDPKLKLTAEAAMAMRRELDGLAATAPRSKIPTWHSQKQAHVQFQNKAEAQVKALLNTNMPAYTTQLEKVKWGDKLAGGGDLASPKDLQSMIERSRMIRKIREKKLQAKTEEELEQKRDKEKEKDKKDRERNRGRDREMVSREHRLKQPEPAPSEPKIAEVQANRGHESTVEEMRRRRQERRHREEKHPLRVKTAAEVLREASKKDKELAQAIDVQMGARCQRLVQLANKGTTDMVLQLMTRKLQRLSEQKELVQAEKKQNSSRSDTLQQLENGTVWCYRTRISHLETEMAKCKEQLLKFLVENQEMLTHRRLRHYFNLLLPNKEEQQQEELPTKGDAAGGDAGISLPADPAQSYESLRLEQDKLRHLQLQEFLARDESNDYELPDLGNVYKAKSYHSFTQPLRRGSPDSSLDSGLSRSQEADDPFHKCGKLYPTHSMARLLALNKGQGDDYKLVGHRRHHKEPSSSGPSYEHIRMRPQDIQEAQFLPRRNH
ncbi:hypothetical protein KR038_001242 [Drosophila bunnanda]|nr:hypothetical protein KR038_001242 [Drosophila bunnanda]